MRVVVVGQQVSGELVDRFAVEVVRVDGRLAVDECPVEDEVGVRSANREAAGEDGAADPGVGRQKPQVLEGERAGGELCLLPDVVDDGIRHRVEEIVQGRLRGAQAEAVSAHPPAVPEDRFETGGDVTQPDGPEPVRHETTGAGTEFEECLLRFVDGLRPGLAGAAVHVLRVVRVVGKVDHWPSEQGQLMAGDLRQACGTLHPLGSADQVGQVNDDDEFVAVDAETGFLADKIAPIRSGRSGPAAPGGTCPARVCGTRGSGCNLDFSMSSVENGAFPVSRWTRLLNCWQKAAQAPRSSAKLAYFSRRLLAGSLLRRCRLLGRAGGCRSIPEGDRHCRDRLDRRRSRGAESLLEIHQDGVILPRG
ncbi:hypothetical protein [Streptomyces aureus]